MTVATENLLAEIQPVPCSMKSSTPLRAVALRRLGLLVFLALTFMTALFLYTRHNDEPSWFHPDEDGKAAQVSSGRYRNFKHPLLLLEATELMTRLRHPQIHIPRGLPTEFRDFAPFPVGESTADHQTIVQDGRLVSAIFGATAATCLAAAGYLAFGWTGLLLSAAMLVLCPQLLLYSHDMKEDS